MASSAGFRIRWNDAEISKILEHQNVPQAVWRAAAKVRDRAKLNITNAGRVDTGAMRMSIVARRIRDRKGVWYEVGSDLPYAIYQHEGVPGPVLPRRATLLRFIPKGGSAYVFAKQTNGFPGEPFLVDAMNSLTVADFHA